MLLSAHSANNCSSVSASSALFAGALFKSAAVVVVVVVVVLFVIFGSDTSVIACYLLASVSAYNTRISIDRLDGCYR